MRPSFSHERMAVAEIPTILATSPILRNVVFSAARFDWPFLAISNRQFEENLLIAY
jgi:hypothetical protein